LTRYHPAGYHATFIINNIVTMRRKMLLLLGLLLCTPLSHASLSHHITQILTHHAPYLNVGIVVENANNGTVYYARNPKRYYEPASNTKLFTASAALLSLGTNYRFDTSISKRGNNLYIKFSGDPSLSKADIEQLLRQAKAKGLTSIKGNVILDTTTFSGPAHPLGWVATDMAYCFGAPIDSVIIDQNCTYLTLFKKGKFAVPAPSDKLPINASGSVSLKPGTDPKTCVFHITDKPDNQVIFSGCLPDRASWGFPLAVPNPTLYAQQLVRQDLTKLGIRLSGQVTIGKQPSQVTVLATHQSDSLQRLMQVMLQQSNNIYAGAITKMIGLHYYGVGSHKAGRQCH
jgi:D-alanyl-D-alanine carboxypeptidase/D-alanyl-D-alanine-endopeptidase (penicillin-binding protein 4)